MAVGGRPKKPAVTLGSLDDCAQTMKQLHLTDRVAELRFEIIRPLVVSAEVPPHFQKRRSDLMGSIARQAGVSSRTIYHWLRLWRLGGLAALRRRERCDRNVPTVVTLAALEFLRDAMRSPNTKSVRWIYHAYHQERWLRLGDVAVEQFPPVSYETVRTWVKDGSISVAICRLQRRSMIA